MNLKVLFVSSGNSINGISPIIQNQGDSIKSKNIELDYYTIKGKGVTGYLKAVFPLRRFLKSNNYDLVHAHYSLSAFVASLAGAKPLVVSLMGSDVKSNKFFKLIIKLFNTFFWSQVIVKSKEMDSNLGIRKVKVIPNGVDFNNFKPLNQVGCKKALGWNLTKKQILFASNPDRKVKNYPLAQKAFTLLHDNECELKVLDNVPNHMIPQYLNAANVVLLTSLWEGSPNVIKEAMACNRPIVSTNVGDVAYLLNDVKASFLTELSMEDVKLKITLALDSTKSNGRTKIKILQLDSESVAKRILSVYQFCLKKRNHNKNLSDLL